jgi:hypothetical protein
VAARGGLRNPHREAIEIPMIRWQDIALGDIGVHLDGSRSPVSKRLTRGEMMGTHMRVTSRREPQRSIVAVFGDTHGVPFCHLAHWWVKPRARNVIAVPQPCKSDLLALLVQAEAFYFFGHGTWKGDLRLQQGVSDAAHACLTLADVMWIAQERKRLGMPRMRYVELRACYSLRTAAALAVWLELAEEVRGFPDVTARWDCGIYPMVTFRHPISHDPGPTDPSTCNERRRWDRKAMKMRTRGR